MRMGGKETRRGTDDDATARRIDDSRIPGHEGVLMAEIAGDGRIPGIRIEVRMVITAPDASWGTWRSRTCSVRNPSPEPA